MQISKFLTVLIASAAFTACGNSSSNNNSTIDMSVASVADLSSAPTGDMTVFGDGMACGSNRLSHTTDERDSALVSTLTTFQSMPRLLAGHVARFICS